MRRPSPSWRHEHLCLHSPKRYAETLLKLRERVTAEREQPSRPAPPSQHVRCGLSRLLSMTAGRTTGP